MAPPELLDARDRGELIICVGPALARSAGLPDLTALAHTLLADAEGSARDASLREWLAAGRVEEVLELLERRMGPRFHRIVERELDDRSRPPPGLARAIAALEGRLRAVYTTGLDHLLERAFAAAWPSFSSPQADLARRRELIVKLCGTLEFPETWVLTRAAFEREFGERAQRRQLFTAVCRAHCLLLVGFDPAEPTSERLLALVGASTEGEQPPNHFLVTPQCDRDRRLLLARRGLHVLLGDAEALLEALAGDGTRRESAAARELPSCPYPGLRAFDRSLAPVFHGRDAELSAAASRLGGPPNRHRLWLAIEGSSGVGKSSFVHAGLIPALRRGFAEGTPTRWWIVSLRPGRRPLRALAAALSSPPAAADESPPRAAWALDENRDAISSIVAFVREHTAPGSGLLVVVDQLEELVTLASATERSRFVACLSVLLEQRLIYLVTTLRSDFTATITSTVPALARLLNDQAERYSLAPISRVGLRAAIAEPAAQLGVRLDLELVERIASDAEHHLARRQADENGVVRTDDASLPLVAHLLRGLWDARATRNAELSLAEYEALGGVSGALSRTAEALIAHLDNEQRLRTKALLLRMVDLDDGRWTRRALGRAEALLLAGDGDEGEQLLRLLSGGLGPRLLVVRGEGAEAVVELIHQALLREWDTLRGWLAASRAQLARDEALARRAAAWLEQGRPWRSLPRGPERRELLRGRPRGEGALRQRDYQRAMRAAAWLRAGAWLGFCALLGGLGHGLRAAGQRAADEVHARNLEREAITRLLDMNHCREATVRVLASPFEFPELLAQAASCELVVGELDRLEHDTTVTALAVVSNPDADEDEVWIGYEDGSIALWNLYDHRRLIGPLPHLDEAIERIGVAPDGSRVAIASEDHTYLLDQDGEPIEATSKLVGGDPVFAPDGAELATRSGDRLNVYHSFDGELLWSRAVPGTIQKHIFSSAGEELIVGSASKHSGTITRHRADELVGRPITVSGFLRDIAVAPNSNLVASTADDNYTRLWSLVEGKEIGDPLALDVINDSYKFVDFSSSGELLVTLRSNESILVTDRDLKPLSEREPVHPSPRPRFSPDDRWLLAADPHERATLQNARTGRQVAVFPSSSGTKVMSFSPAGDGVLLSRRDKELSHWALDTRDHWRAPNHEHGVYALTFSARDPRLLLSGSSDKTAHTWRVGADELVIHELDDWVIALRAAPDHDLRSALTTGGTIFHWSGTSAPERRPDPRPCEPTQGAWSESLARLALICDDRSVEVWDFEGPKHRQILKLTGEPSISAVSISATGELVAVGRGSGALELWRLRDHAGERLKLIEAAHASAIKALAFDTAGAHLLSGGNDDRVKLWALADTSRVVVELSMPGNVWSVAISSDARLLAAGEYRKGRIALWEREDGLSEYRYHEIDRPSLEVGCEGHGVRALSVSPDDELLAAGCLDGSVHAWPIGERALIELACQRLAHTSRDAEGLPTLCSSWALRVARWQSDEPS